MHRQIEYVDNDTIYDFEYSLYKIPKGIDN